MESLLHRLRLVAAERKAEFGHPGICAEAADKIEQLQAVKDDLYEALDAALRSRGVFTPGSDNYLSPLEQAGIDALAKALDTQEAA
jgi:hypothetical protein